MGGTVDRRRIREQEDWAPKELQGDVGSAKLARHDGIGEKADISRDLSGDR